MAALDQAADLEIESAADGEWPPDGDARDAHLEQVVEAVHRRDRWLGGDPTAADIACLAGRAAEEQQPADWPEWPKSNAAAEELLLRATATRDLLMARDTYQMRAARTGDEPPGPGPAAPAA